MKSFIHQNLIRLFIHTPYCGFVPLSAYLQRTFQRFRNCFSEISQGLTPSEALTMNSMPYWLGIPVGYGFDILSKLTGKKFSVSSVRVKKFCATTQFDATLAHSSGFNAPYTLSEGLHRTLQYEFINADKDNITFVSE